MTNMDFLNVKRIFLSLNDKVFRLLLIAFGFISGGVGCDNRATVPPNAYPAQFDVENFSQGPIWVQAFSEFGTVGPMNGVILPGSSKMSTALGSMNLPELTQVSWCIGTERCEPSNTRTSTIDVRKHIPKGVPGTIVFAYSADGTWTVRFRRRREE